MDKYSSLKNSLFKNDKIKIKPIILSHLEKMSIAQKKPFLSQLLEKAVSIALFQNGVKKVITPYSIPKKS